MNTKTLQTITVVLLAGFIGYFVGVSKVSYEWKNFRPNITIENKGAPAAINTTADFSQFWTVWQKLQNSYYDKKAIDAKAMVNGAISGMVESINDPYTMYLPPTQNTDFKDGLAGKFEGIGAELGMRNKQLIVVAPLDGSPAKRGGIQVGDAILKVNEQPTAGWTIGQAVEKIRGQKGTPVALEVLHKDAEKVSVIKIVRDTIIVKSVDAWIKKVKDIQGVKLPQLAEQKVAYIRLSQFGDNTNKEWTAAINTLYPQLTEDVKGIILDLRNNPGGYLTDATYVASEFLPEGKTVVTQDDGVDNKNSFTVTRAGVLLGQPLIVLINKGSASASEIVAGALRDHGRARLVGDVSFGKGTIQQAEDLGAGAGLHVTVAKWLTPKGTWVHGKGLTPDISIENDLKDQEHDKQLEKAVETLVR